MNGHFLIVRRVRLASYDSGGGGESGVSCRVQVKDKTSKQTVATPNLEWRQGRLTWEELRLPWLKYELGQSLEVAFLSAKNNKSLLKVKFAGPEIAGKSGAADQDAGPNNDFHPVTLTKFIAHFKIVIGVELIDAGQPQLANTIYRRATMRSNEEETRNNESLHEMQDDDAQMETALCDIESVEELLAEAMKERSSSFSETLINHFDSQLQNSDLEGSTDDSVFDNDTIMMITRGRRSYQMATNDHEQHQQHLAPLHSLDQLASPGSLRSPISETFEYEKSKNEKLPLCAEFGAVRLAETHGELNQADRIVAVDGAHINTLSQPIEQINESQAKLTIERLVNFRILAQRNSTTSQHPRRKSRHRISVSTRRKADYDADDAITPEKKMSTRFSRRNRRQVTIGTADMKRINRRYTSMKKYLRIDRDKMDKASKEAQRQYHEKVVHMIAERDFFDKLDDKTRARDFLLDSQAAKHIINRVRRSADSFFGKYEFNHDLVKFINLYTQGDEHEMEEKELPQGWKAFNVEKRVVYANLSDEFTTYYHPALIEETITESVEESEADIEAQTAQEDEDDEEEEEENEPLLEYQDQVVLFLNRNSNERLIERLPALKSSPNLQKILSRIRTEGVVTYERYVNVGAFAQFLSYFDADIIALTFDQMSQTAVTPPPSTTTPPTDSTMPSTPTRSQREKKAKSPMEMKINDLYARLESEGYGQGPHKLKMPLERTTFLEDAFKHVMSKSKKELQRNKLFITFKGEEGLDYSGPSREFFHLASRELFNPYYCWFEYTPDYKLQISDHSLYNCNNEASSNAMMKLCQRWFQFMGRLLGLALIHRYLVDAKFIKPIYSLLLKRDLTVDDLKYVDEDIYTSLMWVKDNNIEQVQLNMFFEVDVEIFGRRETRELVADGSQIEVTESNKLDYIQKMVRFRLEHGIKPQMDGLAYGFNEVVNTTQLKNLEISDLELILNGAQEIDCHDWRSHTEYRGGYFDSHDNIQLFWQFITQLSDDDKMQFLQFVTGTKSIPYEGFAGLRGPNGPKPFCIELLGTRDALPQAHTCFNRIDLPNYMDFELMTRKITYAMREGNQFAIQ